ncbi:GNAT family N-acetyltransferase [Lactobacillus plantarum]|uniref:GNAT family N-acetyltransferase n=1 Tax=Lactiplantibacillus plantarum TaxID=1590 RepID=UPI0013D7DE1E|nr:GNAT family N-acetyltransferase [Lactiplantibacillus plantarum]MCT3229032.1 GNAT family N-acetyltransferase [Lactiplantibacillus plantarum]NFA50968.1 GNAT family N-acetyltransferase [Lactiplantibacillus plantarum]
MQFITTSFDELTVRQLQQIYKLRVAVFVVEQACPYQEVVEQACPYQEVDDTDLMAWHLRGMDSTGQLLVYARLMREANQQARIGRVITNPIVRGHGYGQQLLQQAIVQIQALWPSTTQINIQAQHYLDRFYRGFGFQPVSGVYLEDGIPHQNMILTLN